MTRPIGTVFYLTDLREMLTFCGESATLGRLGLPEMRQHGLRLQVDLLQMWGQEGRRGSTAFPRVHPTVTVAVKVWLCRQEEEEKVIIVGLFQEPGEEKGGVEWVE